MGPVTVDILREIEVHNSESSVDCPLSCMLACPKHTAFEGSRGRVGHGAEPERRTADRLQRFRQGYDDAIRLRMDWSKCGLFGDCLS